MSTRYFWVLVVYVINFLSGIVGIPIVHGLVLHFTTLADKQAFNQSVVIWNIVANLITLFVIWLLLRQQPATDKVLRGARASVGMSVVWAVLGVLMLFAGQVVAGLITQFFTETPAGSANTEMLTSLTKQAPVLFVFITLIAPVIEEIVFRKVLFGGLTNWINIHVAAVISSLFFALGHGDLPFLLVYFSIGLILCFLYTKTKRITVTIFAHMIMNAIVLLFSLGGVS